ncbi:MAG: outer membrane protein assembly factor BamC [Methylobacter sp.]|nr:outer membrane protein assembly factor BamC [Methylobacter sp.]
MSVIVKSLLLIGILVSCGTTEESRYRNTENLERPPTVVSSSPSREQRVVDNSSIPKKKDSTGLGSDVYLVSPSQLNIKQSFDDAWETLNQALKQSDIKITDHERDKGLYYVSQDNAGFFEKASSFFSDDGAIYLLTVKQEDEETTVSITIANAAEQSSTAESGAQPPSVEGAEDLMQILFKTLRDKIEEE